MVGPSFMRRRSRLHAPGVPCGELRGSHVRTPKVPLPLYEEARRQSSDDERGTLGVCPDPADETGFGDPKRSLRGAVRRKSLVGLAEVGSLQVPGIGA